MAAKTPNLLSTLRAAPTTELYVDPETGRGVNGGTLILGDGMTYQNLRHRVFAFANIDNTDTWASGIKGIREVCARDLADTASVLAVASAGTVTFTTSADNLEVLLHVWSAA